MTSADRLMYNLRFVRPVELQELKKSGKKIIGYPPGNYLPEELIYASGAVPVCLLRGGDPEAVAESSAYIVRFIDTFCRSQIGYWALKEDPIYTNLDLLVFPVTDINQKAIADCWNYYTDTEVFRFGVPHTKSEAGLKYYAEGLRLARGKIEAVTGNKITDDKLKEAIKLYNRIRKTLRQISLLRKDPGIAISGKDFAKLNHASYLLDPEFLAAELENIRKEAQKTKGEVKFPRLLMTASTLALGDYKVLNLVEETGAAVVIEEIPEGFRNYWYDVSLEGDAMDELARVFYMEKAPPAFFRPSSERLHFIIKLAEEFNVDGIIWYQLMYRESYDIQYTVFSKIVKEKLKVPVLKVQSDYDALEIEALRTRIETFVETVREHAKKRKGKYA